MAATVKDSGASFLNCLTAEREEDAIREALAKWINFKPLTSERFLKTKL